jgi:hypothetical protein
MRTMLKRVVLEYLGVRTSNDDAVSALIGELSRMNRQRQNDQAQLLNWLWRRREAAFQKWSKDPTEVNRAKMNALTDLVMSIERHEWRA